MASHSRYGHQHAYQGISSREKNVKESRDCIHTLVFYSSTSLLPSIVTPMSLSESRNKRRIGMPTSLLLLLHPFTSPPIRKSLSLLPARNIFPTKSRHLPTTTTINLKFNTIMMQILFFVLPHHP